MCQHLKYSQVKLASKWQDKKKSKGKQIKGKPNIGKSIILLILFSCVNISSIECVSHLVSQSGEIILQLARYKKE